MNKIIIIFVFLYVLLYEFDINCYLLFNISLLLLFFTIYINYIPLLNLELSSINNLKYSNYINNLDIFKIKILNALRSPAGRPLKSVIGPAVLTDRSNPFLESKIPLSKSTPAAVPIVQVRRFASMPATFDPEKLKEDNQKKLSFWDEFNLRNQKAKHMGIFYYLDKEDLKKIIETGMATDLEKEFIGKLVVGLAGKQAPTEFVEQIKFIEKCCNDSYYNVRMSEELQKLGKVYVGLLTSSCCVPLIDKDGNMVKDENGKIVMQNTTLISGSINLLGHLKAQYAAYHTSTIYISSEEAVKSVKPITAGKDLLEKNPELKEKLDKFAALGNIPNNISNNKE